MTNNEDAASQVRTVMTHRRRRRRSDRSEIAATIRWLNELRRTTTSGDVPPAQPQRGRAVQGW